MAGSEEREAPQGSDGGLPPSLHYHVHYHDGGDHGVPWPEAASASGGQEHEAVRIPEGRHAYAVWVIPGHPEARGVHTGGQAAWWHLSRLFPGGARPHVFGVRLRRFENVEEALIGYVKEASHHGAPIPVPTHLH